MVCCSVSGFDLQAPIAIIYLIILSTMQNCEELHADFCPKCGSLIELDTLFAQVTCAGCKGKLSFKQFVGKPIRTRLNIKTGKEWLKKYTSTTVEKERRKKTKMTIKEACPKCEHPQLKYYTVQTRSADEGSTIFYECEKCGHTFSVNN